MKKYKQRILDALKKKFEGVSENVLDKYADKLDEKATDENSADKAVEETTFQKLLESESDRRANEASNSAVVNYEKKHGLKDGRKIQQEPNPNPGTGNPSKGQHSAEPEDQDEEKDPILRELRALREKVAGLEKGSISKSRDERLTKAINGASDLFQRTIKSSYDHMSFKDESAFDQWIESIEKDAQEDAKANSNKRAVFGRPFNGGKSDDEGEVPESIRKTFEKKETEDDQPF